MNSRLVKTHKKPAVSRDKKLVIKQYDIKPFFIRTPSSNGGADMFLSVRLTLEFLRKDLPEKLKTQKKLLRTLIYKQLKKDFENGNTGHKSKEKFKKHLIPALNTFFKGGGVYTVRFKELEKR